MVFFMLDANRDVSKENFSPIWQRHHKMFRLTGDDPKPIPEITVINTTTGPQNKRSDYYHINLELTSGVIKLLGVQLDI